MWTAFVLFVPFVVKNANPNRVPFLQASQIAIEVNPSHQSLHATINNEVLRAMSLVMQNPHPRSLSLLTSPTMTERSYKGRGKKSRFMVEEPGL